MLIMLSGALKSLPSIGKASETIREAVQALAFIFPG